MKKVTKVLGVSLATIVISGLLLNSIKLMVDPPTYKIAVDPPTYKTMHIDILTHI